MIGLVAVVDRYEGGGEATASLVREAVLEYGARGVRVDAVCPGPTQTRMIASLES